MTGSKKNLLDIVNAGVINSTIPEFRVGDTIRVHCKIIEGTKERVQIFEGAVIARKSGSLANASFTVRKVSYNVGVERTFPLHSPRIAKIEVVTKGSVRRAKLYYLRNLSGKAARIKSDYEAKSNSGAKNTEVAASA